MDEVFSTAERAKIESLTQTIGQYLFDHLEVQKPTVFERRWWDDRVLGWAMQDESVKVQMFRFIDVLPMLRTSEALVRHLHESFEEVRAKLPSAVRLGMAVATPGSVTGRALAMTARRNVMGAARRFIAGSNLDEVLAAARRERRHQRGFTLDILGEAVISDREAEQFFQSYLELIEGVAPRVNDWPEVEQIDTACFDDTGPQPIPRANISIKLSALDGRFDPIDAEGAYQRAGGRLRELLRVAARNRCFINVDMESYAYKDLTLSIFRRVLEEPEFRDTTDVGIVIQSYLKDSPADLVALRDWAKDRGAPVWVRLVKGAYWDYETIHAAEQGWPVPVFGRKWRTDANHERLTQFLVANSDDLRPAIGSHNLRSLAVALATADHLELPRGALEIQMLYGMGDAEKQALVDRGHRMRIYMPYGELIPGMAYLVRRLLENTSNDSFLRAGFTEEVAPEILMQNPEQMGESDSLPEEVGGVLRMVVTAPQETTFSFANEPLADFSKEETRVAMQSAIDDVLQNNEALGKDYPLAIGSERTATDDWIESHCPSDKSVLLGRVASATAEQADSAVEAAKEVLPAWAALSACERGDYLRRAAEVMRQRRYELAAWIIVESGKTWREADGDIAEAIDFCEFYAAAAEAMEHEAGIDVPGEENRFEFLPRGVTAVIAPWNFPLAILTGMTAAALATGNTVVMKPAEQTGIVGALLWEIFAELKLPAGVLNFLPGRGEVVGARLVEHPDVALIAFTGSREVGLAINARAAEVSRTETRFVKKVIAEMGGKNAILVDEDADLDEAVAGVAKSAFSFQGQKCSACSRAIVHTTVYDAFLERLVEAARTMQVGPADEPGSDIGPVIDKESLAKIHRYIKAGCEEGREVLATDVGNLAQQGHFVGPHIFADVPPDARIAQEEIFGPVLAVIRAADLDEAIAIANDTNYGLTAGIYSRSPGNLNRARRELQAGNIYLNRPITGALVCRQPFGGFRLSGIGSKAGSADYLLQFVVPRTVTENTMRRGFAPPASGE